MSLIRLLAVGRSIATIRDAPSRYKMIQQNLLPRFGPAKANGSADIFVPGSSVSACPDVEASGTSVVREQALVGLVALPAASNRPATSGPNGEAVEEPFVRATITREAEEKAEISEQRTNTAESEPGRVRMVASPWRGWPLLGYLRAGKSKARRGHPIQAELALEAIKPVCNDLNDTDLEILPISKPALRPETEVKASPSRIGCLVGNLWRRAGALLVKFRTRET